MGERSKWELYGGIAAIAMGVLYGGTQLLSLFVSGEYTEYFDGWWLAFEIVAGVFLLLCYRSERFRQFTNAVGESIYFKLAWSLLCL